MKYKLVKINFVDMYHFQLYEGVFEDVTHAGDTTKYIYANISNFDCTAFIDSDVRIYSQPFEELYCTEDYEICDLYSDELCTYLKSEILAHIN